MVIYYILIWASKKLRHKKVIRHVCRIRSTQWQALHFYYYFLLQWLHCMNDRIILENKTYQNCPKEKAVHLSAHCHQNSGNVKKVEWKNSNVCLVFFRLTWVPSRYIGGTMKSTCISSVHWTYCQIPNRKCKHLQSCGKKKQTFTALVQKNEAQLMIGHLVEQQLSWAANNFLYECQSQYRRRIHSSLLQFTEVFLSAQHCNWAESGLWLFYFFCRSAAVRRDHCPVAWSD